MADDLSCGVHFAVNRSEQSYACLRETSLARLPDRWHFLRAVKTLTLEEIYADPHKLDPYLDSGESVAVVRDGREVAELVPLKAGKQPASAANRPWPDFRARFLKMWGPDAFNSQVSVAEEFEELRRQRPL